MNQDPEILKIQPSDNPGMSLVSTLLDGTNFLTWSSCGASKEMTDINNEDHLMQFLMGLNETYDNVRNQILMQEPLPNVSKAYAMILRVEKQREVHSGSLNIGHNMAMQARGGNFKRFGNTTTSLRKKTTAERRAQVCEHCGKNGHTKEVCFEIHGYPEWYRNLVEQRRRDGASTSRTFTVTSTENHAQNAIDELTISEMIRNELQRYMGDADSAITESEDQHEFSGKDHKTKTVVGIGRLVGRLYVLDNQSFDPRTIKQCTNIVTHLSLNTVIEPRSYGQANKYKEWQQAMKVELEALENNHTWEIVPLPPDKKAIGCRWIYKLKVKADGSIERCKARLVAKGYSQVAGIDYVDSFSPVAKSVTVRIFLAVAAALHWHIHQLDVNNAFLHGYLEEEIYMQPPEGYEVPTGHVCRLKRSSMGLNKPPDSGTKNSLKNYKLMVSYSQVMITVYSLRYSLSNAKAATTPLPPGIKFSTTAENQLLNPESYRRLIGRLLYLSFSRPDISHATQQLSQYMQTPCQQHWNAALHLVKYLKGTPCIGLFFPAEANFSLKAYSDADWAACVDARRSLTGYCIFLGSALISWKTKKQSTVSRSTAEAEYRSMGTTVCELTWIFNLLQDLNITIPTPIPFLCDNRAALHIVANPVFHERTKP
ncbi:UNVERIFIED_CONTAM: Retrovirus-related Pol polyprotein from transposon RE2 [Sesamum radiatum]|uniref:Retrovirus-related Pol polyprotein from transposon RE2 n=1 Tax=Sesamum radiatum TaxID=300843 RepID=A0AAW2QFN9_SESRA